MQLNHLKRSLVGMAKTAWRRTMETLARIRVDTTRKVSAAETAISHAQARFTAVYEFCNGDLSQNIYNDLIRNENNMRPNEINSLFRVSDLADVCTQIANKKPLLDHFGETNTGKANGRLREYLEEFFDRRNRIAHSLNPSQSSGRDQVFNDIAMFKAFGKSLCETLDKARRKPNLTPIRNGQG